MNLIPIIVALLAGGGIYALGMLFMPQIFAGDSTKYTLKHLKGLELDSASGKAGDASVMREQYQETSGLARVFYVLPLTKMAEHSILRAGLNKSVEKFFIGCVVAFFLILVLAQVGHLANHAVLNVVIAVIATYVLGWLIIRNKIQARAKKFMVQFPDALDIIVRSVKSGFPINAAVNMVAESMTAPISEEFKQISDEVAHGSTLVDALNRMAERTQTPDVRFFTVVLSLQQDVGGNLAEALSNLSSIIRKRKMMKLKIHALTSEGRATGWVLGSLPVFVGLAINFMSPDFLTPLLTTSHGHTLLWSIVIMIAIGVGIVRKMTDMEI